MTMSDSPSSAAAPAGFGTAWFVVAGPGDPDLITVKGRDLIARAGAILFASSLVNEAATRWAPPGEESEA
jgi:precorrin-4/cobalt-precorrin-4 C11-methyltransferase